MVRKKILMIFDVPNAIDLTKPWDSLIFEHEDYRDEADVAKTLKSLGHHVGLAPIFDDLQSLITILKKVSPDLVFCMFESFQNERHLAPKVVAVLEMLGIPFTGGHSLDLSICQDKALSKKILSFHGVKTPKFKLIRLDDDIGIDDLQFPCIVKPAGLDASEGISSLSVVHQRGPARKRVQFLRRRYGCDVLIEEYIAGREFYVGVIGDEEPRVLAPQELFFGKIARSTPKIASYRAKWDPVYRQKNGIDSGRPMHLAKNDKKNLQDTCRKAFEALNLEGYARIDCRMDQNGDVYVIEVNPNPAIKRNDDFPNSAKDAGLSYKQLISSIVAIAS